MRSRPAAALAVLLVGLGLLGAAMPTPAADNPAGGRAPAATVADDGESLAQAAEDPFASDEIGPRDTVRFTIKILFP